MQSVENDLRADQSSQPGVLIVETESFHKKLLQFIALGSGFLEWVSGGEHAFLGICTIC